jgi:hypothetical protein
LDLVEISSCPYAFRHWRVGELTFHTALSGSSCIS